MASNLRSRGKEAIVEVHVDGPRRGSFSFVTSQSFRARQEIKGTQFNNKKVETLDVEHMGWEGDFEIQKSDGAANTVLDLIVASEENGTTPPVISITWTDKFRNGLSESYSFTAVKMVHDGDSRQGGDYASTKWKWQAEKRQRIA